MGFILKTLIILVVIGVGGSFLINRLPNLKQRVIEVVNPDAKEARLLNELGGTLNELESNINQKINTKGNGDLITKAKGLLNQVAQANQDSGIVGSTLGKIIDSLIDKAPFPADHLKLESLDNSNQANNCPSPQPN